MDGADLCEQPVLVIPDRRIIPKKPLCNLGLLFADSAPHNAVGFSAEVSANRSVKGVVVILRVRIVSHRNSPFFRFFRWYGSFGLEKAGPLENVIGTAFSKSQRLLPRRLLTLFYAPPSGILTNSNQKFVRSRTNRINAPHLGAAPSFPSCFLR